MGSGLDRIASNLSRGNLFPNAANFTHKLFYQNCATPWWVYAETFAPAFLELFVTIAFLQMDDLIRERGRVIGHGPGGRTLRGGGHARKGPIPGYTPNNEKYAQKGLRHLLKVTDPLEKLGFAFLLYGATEDFFYDWSTLLEAREWCKDPTDAGPLSRSRTTGGFFPQPGLGACPLPILEQNRSGWATSTVSAGLPPGHYNAHFAVTIEGPAPGGVEYEAGFNVTGTLLGGTFRGGKVATDKGIAADLVVGADFFLPGLTGGSIVWGVSGPQVPIGLQTKKGFCVIAKTG